MKKIFISKKAQKHSSKGDFGKGKNGKLILIGGGHGQENIDFLNKKKIDNNVTLLYNHDFIIHSCVMAVNTFFKKINPGGNPSGFGISFHQKFL